MEFFRSNAVGYAISKQNKGTVYQGSEGHKFCIVPLPDHCFLYLNTCRKQDHQIIDQEIKIEIITC